MPNFFSLGKLQRAEMLPPLLGQSFIPHVFIRWYLSANSVSSKERYRIVFIGHSVVAAACNILSVEAAIDSVLVAVGKPPPGKQWHDVLRSALTRSLQPMAKGHLHQLESWMSRWLNNVNQGIEGRNKVSSGQLTQSRMLTKSGNLKDVAAQNSKVENAEVPEGQTEPETPNTRQRRLFSSLFPEDDDKGPQQDKGERKEAKQNGKPMALAKGKRLRMPENDAASGDDDNSSCSSRSASPRHKSRTPSPRKTKPVCVPSDPIIVLLPVQLPSFLDSATTRGLH
jgi:hypothetical protein